MESIRLKINGLKQRRLSVSSMTSVDSSKTVQSLSQTSAYSTTRALRLKGQIKKYGNSPLKYQ